MNQLKRNKDIKVQIRISKAKVITYVVAAIFLIVLGVVSIAADSGGFALLILLLGIFWITYCLPYLVKINQPYLKINQGKLFYNHSFKRLTIKLNQIQRIQVKNDSKDISNDNLKDIPLNVKACLIRIYLKNNPQPLVINPTYVGDARDFGKFEKVAEEVM